jgi:hypothetical protein
MRTRRDELTSLSDAGDANDLAEFSMLLHDEDLFTESVRADLEEVCTATRAELNRQARPLGERLFAEPLDRLVDRIDSCWDHREYEPDP